MHKNIAEIIRTGMKKMLYQPLTTSNTRQITEEINNQVRQILPLARVQVDHDEYDPSKLNISISCPANPGFYLKYELTIEKAKTHIWTLINDHEKVCVNCNMISSSYTVINENNNEIFYSNLGDFTCEEMSIKDIIE